MSCCSLATIGDDIFVNLLNNAVAGDFGTKILLGQIPLRSGDHLSPPTTFLKTFTTSYLLVVVAFQSLKVENS